jgi:integrase
MPTIEKRGHNSWRLEVEDGRDANGKRIRWRKTITIEDEALLKTTRKLQDYLQNELMKFRQEIESGQYIKPDRTTFDEFVQTWKTNYADSHLGEYTRRNYLYIIKSHLFPAFGSMELNKIKTMHVVSFLSRLRTSEGRLDGKDMPLSTNSILNIYKTLKSILDCATKWKLIPSNPMDGVDRPVADKSEKKALKQRKHSYSKSEVESLIAALFDEPEQWRLYFMGALLGGFRRSELLAVEWSQVDFELGSIHVTKQISMNENGQRKEAELKTEESEAFVAMPRWYMNALWQFREQWIKEKWHLMQNNLWRGGDKQFLFHNGTGLHFYPSAPTQRWIDFLDKHDLPRIRLHDLRHTTAMLLLEDGADMKAVQERLRHARLSTTSDFYTHESELINRRTADRLEKLNPFKNSSQA